MTVIDISQEVFSCQIYPGDPKPEKTALLRVANGDVCNLTAFSMCAHNGTHIDAPYHFIEGGRRVDALDVSVFVGDAYVARRAHRHERRRALVPHGGADAFFG